MFQTVTPTELCSPKDVFRLRLNIAKQYRDGSGEDQSLFLLLLLVPFSTFYPFLGHKKPNGPLTCPLPPLQVVKAYKMHFFAHLP